MLIRIYFKKLIEFGLPNLFQEKILIYEGGHC
jgi:hypothetical protein